MHKISNLNRTNICWNTRIIQYLPQWVLVEFIIVEHSLNSIKYAGDCVYSQCRKEITEPSLEVVDVIKCCLFIYYHLFGFFYMRTRLSSLHFLKICYRWSLVGFRLCKFIQSELWSEMCNASLLDTNIY